MLQDRLRVLNNRDLSAIRRHLDTIHKAIDSRVDGRVDLEFGGSTYEYVGSGCRMDRDLDIDGRSELMIGAEQADDGSTTMTGGLFVLQGG